MKRALIVLASALAVAVPALADEALAKANNCMACHATDKKLVGPAYKRLTCWQQRSSRVGLACGVPFPCLRTPRFPKPTPKSWLPGF